MDVGCWAFSTAKCEGPQNVRVVCHRSFQEDTVLAGFTVIANITSVKAIMLAARIFGWFLAGKDVKIASLHASLDGLMVKQKFA